MKTLRFLVRLVVLSWALVALVGCAVKPATSVVEGDDARQLIRTRIASIRDSILARSAEGIVRDGTDDWSFTGPDGVKFDRAGFIVRTKALFARVTVIESLETAVDQIVLGRDTADVEITQTMVRQEKDPATQAVTRLWLRYREKHRWVNTSRGWCVQNVAFIGSPERRVLPLAP
jgi:hypothetical protein